MQCDIFSSLTYRGSTARTEFPLGLSREQSTTRTHVLQSVERVNTCIGGFFAEVGVVSKLLGNLASRVERHVGKVHV